METLRRRVGYVGLLIAVLSAGLLWRAQPVGAAGTPPSITFFAVWAENRTGFTAPHLDLDVQMDDPDGQVPLTIQSVKVTAPDGTTTFDLTPLFRFPNFGFRGEYFADATTTFGVTTIQTGTYTLTVIDKDGNAATCGSPPGPCTDALNAFPTLAPPNITSPAPFPLPLPPEAIFSPASAINFGWDAVTGAGTMRVIICNADQGSTCGDGLYTSQFLPGTATTFTLPTGVVEPGRRYGLRLEAYDTPSAVLPTANIRATSFRNFSVAGPDVSLFLNQGTFHTGNTLHLGVRLRNDSPASVPVKVILWVGLPGGPPQQLLKVDSTIPPTPPDVSTVVNDLLVYTFKGTEPTGNYVFRLELEVDRGLAAQSMSAFSFSP